MAAIYRQIYLSFWTDSKVDEEFTPEDKYFYLYLLTNPHTNLCGCYEVGVKQMARETGYNEDTVRHLIKRLETIHNVIRYNADTKEMLLLNWSKYNWSKSADLLKGVERSLVFVKSDEFRAYIFGLINGNNETLPTPSPDPRGTSVTVTVTDTDTVKAVSKNNNNYTDDFELFWHEYPRKVGKKDAFEKFKKAKQPVQVLISAVREQKNSEMWTKENGRFIPNPATWLNQGRWDDTLPKPKTGIKNGSGFYTLSNGMETSNPFLAMLDEEVNSDKERDDTSVVHIEGGVS